MIPRTLEVSKASGELAASNSRSEILFRLLVPAVGEIQILQNVCNMTSHHSIPESFFSYMGLFLATLISQTDDSVISSGTKEAQLSLSHRL
jgi:hypothetical protein